MSHAGTWRLMASFDLDSFEAGDLEHAADQLLRLSSKPVKARLVMPGQIPLVTWTKTEGWRDAV
ncbi:MAG: hypothetical protein ACO25M_10975 [Limnohabitans sp.]